MAKQKTLYILRHAKAESGQDDLARPLAERGVREARAMGEYLAAKGISPQKILCSPSVRTRQTLEYVFPPPERGKEQEKFPARLYHASLSDLLSVIVEQPEDAESLMLIGHNPALHELAVRLAREGDEKPLRDLAVHFPPCALAAIEISTAWAKITLAQGRLAAFVTP